MNWISQNRQNLASAGFLGLVFALSATAATGPQAQSSLKLNCKSISLEAPWSGTESVSCTVSNGEAPAANIQLSCVAPAGMSCQVEPAVLRPVPREYGIATVRLTYTDALAPGRSTVEVRAIADGMPALATMEVLKTLSTVWARCPASADLQAIDRDVKLIWDSDPTEGTIECRTADGSRDLTVMQSRVYRALDTMRRLQFTERLPWTRDPVYRWFTRAVRGIRFRADIMNSNCCSADRMINIRSVVERSPNGGQQGLMMAITEARQLPTDARMLLSFLQLLVHEARHADGKPHTCGPNDQTLQEMGAWGSVHAFQSWIVDKMAPDFVPDNLKTSLRRQIEQLCRNSICKGCK